MATPKEISEFDIMRQRIRERELSRGKETSEKVKGQFANRGMLRSGAQIKAQERGRDQVANQAREERRDVLIAEAGIRRAERQAEAQREFQRSERIGQQEFVSGEAAEQRGFLTSERIGQETFARAEAEANRTFTTSEREALQSFQDKQRIGNQNFTTKERIAAEKFARIEAEIQRGFQSDQAALGREQQDRQFMETLAHQQELLKVNKEQYYSDMAFNKKSQTIDALNALKNTGFSDTQITQLLNDLGLPIGLLGLGNPLAPRVNQPYGQPAVAAPGVVEMLANQPTIYNGPSVGSSRAGNFDLGIS